MENAHTELAQHSHGGFKLYTGVLGGLICLTVATVLAAGVDFGSPVFNTVIALLVATAKASLVALFFMHLRWDKPINAMIFVSTLAFLGLLLMLTLIDFDSRFHIVPKNLKAPPAATQIAPSPAAERSPH
jgi:cytochrome c oxidase subunit IV